MPAGVAREEQTDTTRERKNMMTQKEQGSPMRDFLERIAAAQDEHGHGNLSVHRHVLRHGRSFVSQNLTTEEQEYIDRCGWREHEIRQCYHNAQMTALTMPGQKGMNLLYAEGFVGLGMEYGVAHAWLSLNGKVVDTTLRTQKGNDQTRVMGVIPEGWEYLGVELDPHECMHSMEHGRMGPLLDDWQCGWRLVRAGQPAS